MVNFDTYPCPACWESVPNNGELKITCPHCGAKLKRADDNTLDK